MLYLHHYYFVHSCFLGWRDTGKYFFTFLFLRNHLQIQRLFRYYLNLYLHPKHLFKQAFQPEQFWVHWMMKLISTNKSNRRSLIFLDKFRLLRFSAYMVAFFCICTKWLIPHLLGPETWPEIPSSYLFFVVDMKKIIKYASHL